MGEEFGHKPRLLAWSKRLQTVGTTGELGRENTTTVPRRPTSRLSPAAVLGGIRDLVVVVDDEYRLVWCNPAITVMLGWQPEQVIGTSISALVHPDDMATALNGIEHLLNADEIYRVGLRLRTQAGDWMPVSITGLDHSSDPEIGGLVLSARKAEQHTRDLGELQRQMRTDQVTGLLDRQSLHDRLHAAKSIDRADSAIDDELAVCIIGLDRFKHVNDVHGHGVGDQVLATVAQRLQAHGALGDVVARHGGDEFVLALLDPDRTDTPLEIAESVRAALAEPYAIDGNILHLSASVGLACHTYEDLDADRLLQEADFALDAAKRRGRDRVERFDQQLAVNAKHSQDQRTLVRRALAQDELVVHFQPIVNGLLDVVGAESLVRCRDDQGTLQAPSGFLRSVSGTTMAVELDHRVFTASCAAINQLNQDRSTDTWVSCNIAPGTLAQGDFSDRILSAINAASVDPRNVCIEITETTAFETGPISLSALERLHRAGVRIALDDFGTGFSSLSHLSQLPLSRIKIDRSFIASVAAAGPPQVITRSATDLAHSLDCDVVAEGVETLEQLQTVQKMGMDLMQGWLFAKAMPLDDLRDFAAAAQARQFAHLPQLDHWHQA